MCIEINLNRLANAKRPVLFYFEHSRPFQYLSCLHLERKLIVLKFLLSLFHLATVSWEFEASSHKVIVLLFLFIFTSRHFLALRRNDLISYSFKTGFYSVLFWFFRVLLLPWDIKVFSLTVGDFNSTQMIHYKLYF